jgi:diaminopimelate decarboxylase
MKINSKGHLSIEGIDVIDLVEKYGTPLFIISESTLRSNYRKISKAFNNLYKKNIICFSYKSNNGLAVRKILQQEGAGAQCHSLGELYTAQLLGVNPD